MVPMFTIAEVAEWLGVSRSTLQRMRRRGEISFVTVGTGKSRPLVRFTEQHLLDYLARAEQTADALPAGRAYPARR